MGVHELGDAVVGLDLQARGPADAAPIRCAEQFTGGRTGSPATGDVVPARVYAPGASYQDTIMPRPRVCEKRLKPRNAGVASESIPSDSTSTA